MYRTVSAGLLYESGNYAEAVAQIKSLISDKALARTIAHGGRAEVERWGWSAATQTLRRQQYQRAIKHKREGRPLGLHSVANAIVSLACFPFIVLRALLRAAVRLLDYAEPLRPRPV